MPRQPARAIDLLPPQPQRRSRPTLLIGLTGVLITCFLAASSTEWLIDTWDQLTQLRTANQRPEFLTHGQHGRDRQNLEPAETASVVESGRRLELLQSCSPLLRELEEQLLDLRSKVLAGSRLEQQLMADNERLRGMAQRQQIALAGVHRGVPSSTVGTGASDPTPPQGRRRRPRSFQQRLRHNGPTLALLGSDVWITGTVTNVGSESEQPLVLVRLLRDGRVEGRDSQRITVPAGSTTPYEFRIPTGLQEGNYSADIELAI